MQINYYCMQLWLLTSETIDKPVNKKYCANKTTMLCYTYGLYRKPHLGKSKILIFVAISYCNFISRLKFMAGFRYGSDKKLYKAEGLVQCEHVIVCDEFISKTFQNSFCLVFIALEVTMSRTLQNLAILYVSLPKHFIICFVYFNIECLIYSVLSVSDDEIVLLIRRPTVLTVFS